MADVYGFGESDVMLLREVVQWYKNGAPARERRREREPFNETRRRRLAKTTTEDTGSTYPTAASGTNTFWCKFIDGQFDGGYEDAEEGDHTATFTDWTGGEKVLAHSRHGIYFPENTVVEIDQFNGQWWIATPFNVKGEFGVTPATLTTSITTMGLSLGSLSDQSVFSISSNELTVDKSALYQVTLSAQFEATNLTATTTTYGLLSLQKGGADFFSLYASFIGKGSGVWTPVETRSRMRFIDIEEGQVLRVRGSCESSFPVELINATLHVVEIGPNT